MASDRHARSAAARVDHVRAAPERRDELVELLAESNPAYEGLGPHDAARLRGLVLAAFADTGVPETALPYLLAALESGHLAYEVAGAAVGLRGLHRPGPDVEDCLLRALRNLGGADTTLTFEGYDARWPYARPTTCRAELERTLAAVRAAAPAHADGGCSCDATRGIVASEEACEADDAEVVLEDQDGRLASLRAFARDKPTVLTFFYTRCDSPYKCSRAIAGLARLQALAHRLGLAGAFRIAAISYDPDFDLPARLRRYGAARGLVFDDDVRLFRATSGFDRLRRRFDLGVGYGASTVNGHRIELFVLDADGSVATQFVHRRWEPAAVLDAVTAVGVGVDRTPTS